MGSVEIRRVDGRRDLKRFVKVPFRLHRDHPQWVAPLIFERMEFLNPRKNPWFEHAEAQLFVAERDGDVVGFHWTKVEDGVGEVYVVGVDPSAHGGGLGTALTAVGLRHLWAQGVDAIDLYVEGDNDPALAVYRRLGFTEKARDVLYGL